MRYNNLVRDRGTAIFHVTMGAGLGAGLRAGLGEGYSFLYHGIEDTTTQKTGKQVYNR